MRVYSKIKRKKHFAYRNSLEHFELNKVCEGKQESILTTGLMTAEVVHTERVEPSRAD